MTIRPTEKIKPWYRHPWPWILMAGPFVVVVAGFITAYLAVTSNDGLVDDDYYKQGMEVNKVSVRDQKALSLGLQADVMQSADGAQVRVLLRGKPEQVLPEVLSLRIVHPTRSGADQTVLLRAEGGGAYGGKLSALLTGRWHIALEDEKSQWRLTGNWNLEKSASLRLPGEAQAATGSTINSNDKGS
jgi:hypothetical protein